jgi:hypothetical protein
MPLYAYRDPDGKLVELFMSVAEMERRQRGGFIVHDGVRLERDMTPTSLRGNAFGGAKWPLASDCAGVHPEEIPAAMAEARSKGCNLNFTPDGRAIFESNAHRRTALKALGLHDRAGYG